MDFLSDDEDVQEEKKSPVAAVPSIQPLFSRTIATSSLASSASAYRPIQPIQPIPSPHNVQNQNQYYSNSSNGNANVVAGNVNVNRSSSNVTSRSHFSPISAPSLVRPSTVQPHYYNTNGGNNINGNYNDNMNNNMTVKQLPTQNPAPVQTQNQVSVGNSGSQFVNETERKQMILKQNLSQAYKHLETLSDEKRYFSTVALKDFLKQTQQFYGRDEVVHAKIKKFVSMNLVHKYNQSPDESTSEEDLKKRRQMILAHLVVLLGPEAYDASMNFTIQYNRRLFKFAVTSLRTHATQEQIKFVTVQLHEYTKNNKNTCDILHHLFQIVQQTDNELMRKIMENVRQMMAQNPSLDPSNALPQTRNPYPNIENRSQPTNPAQNLAGANQTTLRSIPVLAPSQMQNQATPIPIPGAGIPGSYDGVNDPKRNPASVRQSPMLASTAAHSINMRPPVAAPKVQVQLPNPSTQFQNKSAATKIVSESSLKQAQTNSQPHSLLNSTSFIFQHGRATSPSSIPGQSTGDTESLSSSKHQSASSGQFASEHATFASVVAAAEERRILKKDEDITKDASKDPKAALEALPMTALVGRFNEATQQIVGTDFVGGGIEARSSVKSFSLAVRSKQNVPELKAAISSVGLPKSVFVSVIEATSNAMKLNLCPTQDVILKDNAPDAMNTSKAALTVLNLLEPFMQNLVNQTLKALIVIKQRDAKSQAKFSSLPLSVKRKFGQYSLDAKLKQYSNLYQLKVDLLTIERNLTFLHEAQYEKAKNLFPKRNDLPDLFSRNRLRLKKDLLRQSLKQPGYIEEQVQKEKQIKLDEFKKSISQSTLSKPLFGVSDHAEPGKKMIISAEDIEQLLSSAHSEPQHRSLVTNWKLLLASSGQNINSNELSVLGEEL